MTEFGLELGDVGFAARLRSESHAAERRSTPGSPLPAVRPHEVAPSDWLRFEQDKHSKLLADLDTEIQESA